MNGIKNLKLVALDSNIFIYNLEQNSQYSTYTDIIFKQLINNKLKALTNIISLTEILSFPNIDNLSKQITEDFLSTPNLKIIDIDLQVALEAARIRRKYNFRLPDAIQLATAKIGKVQAFISNDQKLKQFKEVKVISLE